MNHSRSAAGPGWRALPVFALLLVLSGCDSPPNPLDDLQRQLDVYPEFSIILDDMREDGNFFTEYFHRYKLVWAESVPEGSSTDTTLSSEASGELSLQDRTTEWIQVPETVYGRYEPFLGMTLLSKQAGEEISQAHYPPGYQYVGDARYGEWRSDDSGNSFWAFYGRYALMSHLFGALQGPVYRGDWDGYRDYRRQYRQQGWGRTSSGPTRGYYGGNRQYGTRGTVTQRTNPTFFQRQQARQAASSSRFSNKVRDRVSRSRSSGARSRGGRGGK